MSEPWKYNKGCFGTRAACGVRSCDHREECFAAFHEATRQQRQSLPMPNPIPALCPHRDWQTRKCKLNNKPCDTDGTAPRWCLLLNPAKQGKE